MKEFIRQLHLWRVRKQITQAIRRIQAAQEMSGASHGILYDTDRTLRMARTFHNP